MALKIIGYVTCPSCGESASAGISRGGAGKAVHVVCTACTTQVQATRMGAAGQMITTYAASNPVKSKPDFTPFDAWEFDLMDLESD